MIRFNVNGSGFKGFTVPAIPAVFSGVYHDGTVQKPDPVAIKAALPYRWRAAFDRAASMWWPKSACFPARGLDIAENEKPQGHMALHDRRGRYLTTVYANAEEVRK